MRFLIFIFSCLFSFSSFAFSISSSTFKANEMIPKNYSCDGSNISPALTWSGAPKGTKALALVVSDPDAPMGVVYHWIVFNIPVTSKDFEENIQKFPEGAIVGINSFGKNQYSGPCPPSGTHRYFFKLYALGEKLNLTETADAPKVLNEINKHHMGETEVMGKYSK